MSTENLQMKGCCREFRISKPRGGIGNELKTSTYHPLSELAFVNQPEHLCCDVQTSEALQIRFAVHFNHQHSKRHKNSDSKRSPRAHFGFDLISLSSKFKGKLQSRRGAEIKCFKCIFYCETLKVVELLPPLARSLFSYRLKV